MSEVEVLDAGPRGSLAGALAGQEDRLLACVHCGFCLPACPTYRRLGDENDSPRGRLYLMRAVVEGRLEPASDAFQDHIDRCLGCRACEPVCPSGVEYGHLLEKARQVAAAARPRSRLVKTILSTLARRSSMRRAMWLGRVLRDTRLSNLLERLAPKGGRTGMGLAMLNATRPVALSQFPRVLTGMHEAVEEEDGAEVAAEAPPASEREEDADAAVRVAILEGCVQAGLYRRINDATERVLKANGVKVFRVGSQGCCGALHAHAGATNDARSMAALNARAFAAMYVDHIVVNAAGCGAAMKEYGELLRHDEYMSDNGALVSEKVVDVTELLHRLGPRIGAPIPVRVTYDSPCHLEHAQGILDEPLKVLRSIPQLEFVPMAGSSECCGGAGIYGLTHPSLGGRIARDKVEAVKATGAALVATANQGCMMQIGAGLKTVSSSIGVVHPIELLDESYRRAGFYER